MFEVQGLSAAYGQSVVLHGVDFAVMPAEVSPKPPPLIEPATRARFALTSGRAIRRLELP